MGLKETVRDIETAVSSLGEEYYQDGYDQGKIDGDKEGYDRGYDEGHEAGYIEKADEGE